jgi:hypothetical protein
MKVKVTDDEIQVDLVDGRRLAVPLLWYPRLANATPKQRARYRLCGGGAGIHWPAVDEDLSVEGLLAGYRPPPGAENWKSDLLKKRPRRRK